MRHRAALAAALLALALSACGDEEGESAAKPRLVVSAAASMTDALTACSADFANADVKLSFAGSDELAAQIREGVAPDVYAAANTRLPGELHADGLLGRPVEFATNELVLAVPKDSEIDSVADLTANGVTIAIGSESVPIGSYTREALARLPGDRSEAILANVRSNEPDVKGIVGKLTQGAVDAGFVYITDVNAAGGELEAIHLPAAVQPLATYAAGLVTKAPHREQAQAYLHGLREGECADALRHAGFGAAP